MRLHLYWSKCSLRCLYVRLHLYWCQVQSLVFVRADAYTSPLVSLLLFGDSRTVLEQLSATWLFFNTTIGQAHKATIESLLIC